MPRLIGERVHPDREEIEMRKIRLTVLAIGLLFCAQAVQAGWEPTKRLTWNSGYSLAPAIAVDSLGHIHLVWCDYTPGNAEIYYKKSTDAGATWSTNQRLTWTSDDSWKPDLAVDPSGNPHVVWQENMTESREIYYKRSTDKGATWSTAKRLTWNSGDSSIPDLIVDPSGNPHVAWHDKTPGNEEIYFKKSTDGGATWSASQRLTWNSGNSNVPCLAFDTLGKLHLVWGDWTPGNMEIYHKKSTDGGASWLAGQRLTWNEGVSGYPQIALASSTYLVVAWSDSTPGNRETYCKRSTDGGATWLASQRLTWNSGDTWTLALIVDSSKCYHLVWRDTTPGNSELYYKNSPGGGATWTASERLTWTSGESDAPCLAAGPSGAIHVVWEDDTSGNAEIYYRNGN
jgi:hypothetical protein